MPTLNLSSALDAHLPPGKRKHYARDYLYVFAVALLLYGATGAPGVLWQDSGLAQIRTIRGDFDGGIGLALSHPLYYVLTTIFHNVPLGEPAWRTNLVSAVFGAITVANVFLLLRRTTNRFASPLAGAISLAVAHTFWQHCALAEVYTVSTALMTAELLCLERFLDTRRNRWLVLLFLANGLGLSNHVLALLSLACYGVLLVWLLLRRMLRPTMVPAIVVAWAVGSGLYLGMIVDRIAHGAGVGETIREALFGYGYAGRVLNLVPGARQLANTALYMGMNFPTPTALLALAGLAGALRARSPVIGVVVAGLLFVHFVFAMRYNVPDQYTFFVPSIVLIAVLIGWGMESFAAHRSRILRRAIVACCALPALVYIPLPYVARSAGLKISAQEIPHRDAYKYFLHPWKTGERGPERFAEEALAALAPDAFLWADGTTARPIQYLQVVRNLRPDVTLFPPVTPRDEDDGRYREENLQRWLSSGTFYVVTPRYPYSPRWLLDGYELEQTGIVYRVRGRKAVVERRASAGGG